ncbi:GAF domain-containing protein [Pseudomonas sp. KNUC1026]|uniref:GAF domain-containing protein n=1 Tax=Pseudomonas sp. KNUC1026 TaxID=2893890 RepID=UPI001F157E9F|nr:GAF domain-containing protein [Pseudomonas sp. KNUC1026]UFH48456.1 GAF domain-containing protein [Pseudomonas sp. KNUC1026]
MNLAELNQQNKKAETTVFNTAVFSANAWMTLLAPLVIGVLASKLYAREDFSGVEISFFFMALSIHISFASIIFVASNRKSTSLAFDEIHNENKIFKAEVIPRAKMLYEVSRTQQAVIYLMTLELDAVCDEIKLRSAELTLPERIKRWESGLDRILSHLVDHRTQLFGYSPDALYNFALYLFDDESGELVINWRSHDNRLKVSNRRWKPGFGHVGLAFIQGEAKICMDITRSSEISNAALAGSDDRKYRSFISVPIKDAYKLMDGERPLGVLVFTSNETAQFSWERDKLFTLTMAKILSLYIERHITSLMEAKP